MYLVALLLAGCTGADDTDLDTDTDTDTASTAICEDPVDVPCDEIYQDLSLHDDRISEGEVATTQDGADFLTTVDATAGGFGQETEHAWTYIKFTATGAEKLEINDDEALESMDWDIAARRFILRLNGGTSGPSCVGAAAFFESDYADLTEVPGGLGFVMDDYYDDECGIINDSSGLPGSPQVALAPWWEYPGCVATTDVPFLIQRADGSVLKFAVEQYYASGQETCNMNGTPGQAGATYTWRWAWVVAP